MSPQVLLLAQKHAADCKEIESSSSPFCLLSPAYFQNPSKVSFGSGLLNLPEVLGAGTTTKTLIRWRSILSGKIIAQRESPARDCSPGIDPSVAIGGQVSSSWQRASPSPLVECPVLSGLLNVAAFHRERDKGLRPDTVANVRCADVLTTSVRRRLLISR